MFSILKDNSSDPLIKLESNELIEILSYRIFFGRVVQKVVEAMVGRDEAFRICLFTILMGENVLLLGPRGSGKSEVAENLFDMFRLEDVNILKYNFNSRKCKLGYAKIRETEGGVNGEGCDILSPEYKVM